TPRPARTPAADRPSSARAAARGTDSRQGRQARRAPGRACRPRAARARPLPPPRAHGPAPASPARCRSRVPAGRWPRRPEWRPGRSRPPARRSDRRPHAPARRRTARPPSSRPTIRHSGRRSPRPSSFQADAMVNRRWRPRAASRLGGPGSRPGRRRANPPTPRTLSSRGLTKPVDSIREEERMSDTVAAVDWEEHEREALGAIEAAATPAQLEDVRVRYLGRKSELAQALRGVRDRESGITLNGLRGRLEAALDARRVELERAELDRALTQEVVDVTLPGE